MRDAPGTDELPDDRCSRASPSRSSARARRAAPRSGAELAKRGGAAPRVVPATVEPMLAETARRAVHARGLAVRAQDDGYRLLAATRRTATRACSTARGNDVTALFPEIARARRGAAVRRASCSTARWSCSTTTGVPSFQRLQKRAPAHARARDIERAALELPGDRSTLRPARVRGPRPARAAARRAQARCCARCCPPAGPLRYADHVEEHGEAFFAEVERMGLEGWSPRRRDRPTPAAARRTGSRSAPTARGDFVVVGYHRAQGRRAPVSARCTSARYGDGERAGLRGPRRQRLHDAQLEALASELDGAARVPTPPCGGPLPHGSGRHVWVEPELVVRGAVQGVDRRRAAAPAGVPAAARRQGAGGVRARTSATALASPRRGVDDELRAQTRPATRPSRRGDRARAERRRAHEPRQGVLARGGLHQGRPDRVLPRASRRGCCRTCATGPLVLTRYPDGIDGKSFYPEGRARRSRRTGCAPSADVERGRRARDRLLRGRRRRVAASTSPTWARSRSTCGRAASRRSSGPTGASSISTPRARRSRDVVTLALAHPRALRRDRAAALRQDQRLDRACTC